MRIYFRLYFSFSFSPLPKDRTQPATSVPKRYSLKGTVVSVDRRSVGESTTTKLRGTCRRWNGVSDPRRLGLERTHTRVRDPSRACCRQSAKEPYWLEKIGISRRRNPGRDSTGQREVCKIGKSTGLQLTNQREAHIAERVSREGTRAHFHLREARCRLLHKNVDKLQRRGESDNELSGCER